MPVLQVAGGGFVVDQGGLNDDSPFVYSTSDVMASPGPYPLMIVADIVDAVPNAGQVAGEIVRGMAMYLRHTVANDPREAISRAFAIANERVLAENSGRSGMQRLHLGLTCVLVRDDELYVGQCAPSQLLVWQDNELFAIPNLSTWSARDVSGTFSSLSFPLGFQRDIHPRISYSRCAPGDVISVVSWQLAQHLYDSGQLDENTDAATFQQLLPRVTTGAHIRFCHGAVYRVSSASESRFPVIHAVEGSIEDGRPGRLVETFSATQPLPVWPIDGNAKSTFDSGSEMDPGFDTLGAEDSREYALLSDSAIHTKSGGSSGASTFVDLGTGPERFPESASSRHPSSRHDSHAQTSTQTASARSTRSTRSPARKGFIVEIFAGLLLSLSAAVVGVWQITKKDRPIHGPRDDGTLGLPHLQRWSDTYHPPRFDRVRRVSPRFQIHGLLVVSVLVAVVLIGGLFVYDRIASRSADVAASVDERLQEIRTVRAQTDTSVASESGYETLTSAQMVLNDLAASTSSNETLERVQEEQTAVAGALAELTSTSDLGNVQVLGSIPPPAEGVTPRLFRGGSAIFLFSNALYELDQVSTQLVQIIAPGDLVGGAPVGTLLGAAWNDDRPVVVDSHNAYMRDPGDGTWHRIPLGTLSSDGYSGVTAIAAFDRNLYFLTAESGQILKFDALDFSAPPEDWAASSAKEQLQQAVDLYIDGSIHVVLEDGQILTFFRSALDRTLDATIIPELESVSAMTAIASGSYYFMVDGASGRIAGVDGAGELFQQFVPSEGATPLSGATDLVINESNGITYVVTDDTLYAVRITLPPAQAQ